MTPERLKLMRAARAAVVALQVADARKIRKAYGELFHVEPRSTRGTPPPRQLLEEIARELQERAARGEPVRRP